jgi:hypothetical protein
MRYIPKIEEDDIPVVELTRRNLTVLLEKLDDPLSFKMLIDPDHQIAVRAVEDGDHYRDRPPGPVYMPTRGEQL